MKPARSPRAALDTELCYGLHAGLAVFECRRADIVSIAFEPAIRKEIQPLLRWAAEAGVPSREESERALSDRAGSRQHEGLVLGVREQRWLSLKELGAWLASERGTAVALDRVRNPQNVGAILRSAAFFGISAAILGAPAPHPGLSPFARRVAEGGAEHLRMSRTTDLAATLTQLSQSGITVVGADAQAGSPLGELAPSKPLVLVLGNERVGLGPRIRAACQRLVRIEGAGKLDSLNVAVAAGVLFAHIGRPHP